MQQFWRAHFTFWGGSFRLRILILILILIFISMKRPFDHEKQEIRSRTRITIRSGYPNK
jgi:hypothetical protein